MAARFACSYHATAGKLSGACRRRDGRPALVHGSALLRVGSGLLHVLGLSGRLDHMSALARGFFLGSGPRRNSTISAVVADAIHRCIVLNRLVVDVVDVVTFTLSTARL